MDIRKIRAIIDLIKEKEIGEIEISEGEESVRISQFNQATPRIIEQHAPVPVVPSTTPFTAPASAPTKSEHKQTVNSPMVGTFYISPSPDAAPFINIGQQVSPGDVLCIVEAMKMFNQIEADRAGKVVARLVEDGQPVEFDQPLFVIEE
ncbi:MAG: acetyl-CoA carboxylase biotin carboxyl carrier protein [Pseudomonadota bacterium]|nr:acetyl-CoA carboxylase biotin carboxyl carrier protein [Gammaproteobacteria bacterium]MBU1558690.1 acetyl-CoA carboxylase biotin carboxyl carrier protein [Gammaproteobacteria bacterium]MBU1926741.1 acetyl-CoA carboxylase biotin carboxyl carrier protein [Gammaproteobacteria bacterium]MBU2546451.1 acetyl-CoA carboxylase biotin carboxyl carrier protein [Gammaproteobacteria bacterium]